jgi:hypothetical protein
VQRFFFFCGAVAQTRAMASSFMRSLDNDASQSVGLPVQVIRSSQIFATCLDLKVMFIFSVAHQPKLGLRRFIAGVSRSHTIRQTHTHTHTHTHKTGMGPLNELSARRRGHYLHNTQQTYALSKIRTRNPSNQADADLSL